MGVYKYYKDLPPIAKAIVIIGAGVGIAATVISINKSIKKKRSIKRDLIVSQEAAKDLAELIKKGIRPSYQKSQYESFSLKLTEAMNGCGTSESSIYSVMKAMKNKADILSLISAFGIRYYRPCAATQPISFARYIMDETAFGGSLPSWFEYDLTSGEINEINNILKAAKIDFTF